MPRKAIKIRDLIEKVNEMNSKSTCSADMRAGWNALLEVVLQEAEVYKGFDLLNIFNVPEGAAPGIVHSLEMQDIMIPDESRRKYAVARSL